MSIEPLTRLKPMARRLVDGQGASFDTIYRWLLAQVNEGKIPCYELNGVRHVRASEVEAFLQSIIERTHHE